MNEKHGDWCERLATAVADGRYLERPDAWRDHVEGCPACRELVQGLSALRERIEQAASQVHDRGAPRESGEQLIAEAFRRYRRGVRIKGVSLGIVLLVGLGLGVVFWRTGSRTPEAVDPVVYATRLHDRVFRAGRPDYDLLKRDEGLRREYLAALDHESSLVRRTAMHALTWSGIDLEPARLEAVLTTWDEDLEAPLELAATSRGTKHLQDELARRRDVTLHTLISGAYVQAVRSAGRLDAAVLEPFIDHPYDANRSTALRALAADPTYRPGGRVARRLRVDEVDDVRKAAAMLLVERGGEAGIEIVMDYLRSGQDWTSEGTLLPRLRAHPDMLALSRERIADAEVPPQIALHHLRLLCRAGEVTEPPVELVERALAADDPEAWASLACVAGEQDLISARVPLQACWQRCPPGTARSSLARHLVDWDVACQDEERLGLALDILETDRDERLRAHAVTLAKSDLPSIRDRAQNLLSSWNAPN